MDKPPEPKTNTFDTWKINRLFDFITLLSFYVLLVAVVH